MTDILDWHWILVLISLCILILVTYEHPATGLTVTEFLDMDSCTLNNSQELFDAIQNVLSKHHVDWNEYAMYSADNAAKMLCKHNSLKRKPSKLTKERMQRGAPATLFP